MLDVFAGKGKRRLGFGHLTEIFFLLSGLDVLGLHDLGDVEQAVFGRVT
jgi:hypothetical protein